VGLSFSFFFRPSFVESMAAAVPAAGGGAAAPPALARIPAVPASTTLAVTEEHA